MTCSVPGFSSQVKYQVSCIVSSTIYSWYSMWWNENMFFQVLHRRLRRSVATKCMHAFQKKFFQYKESHHGFMILLHGHFKNYASVMNYHWAPCGKVTQSFYIILYYKWAVLEIIYSNTNSKLTPQNSRVSLEHQLVAILIRTCLFDCSLHATLHSRLFHSISQTTGVFLSVPSIFIGTFYGYGIQLCYYICIFAFTCLALLHACKSVEQIFFCCCCCLVFFPPQNLTDIMQWHHGSFSTTQ